ncbi:MAG: hypothetical protein K1V70_04340 [Alistipes sp.]|jgi:hypothetical protein|nr:hypothetical protein [Alistipes sp.]
MTAKLAKTPDKTYFHVAGNNISTFNTLFGKVYEIRGEIAIFAAGETSKERLRLRLHHLCRKMKIER